MGIPVNVVPQAIPSGDQANGLVSGAFTAASQVSAAYAFRGAFNVVLYGPSGPNGNWTGTVQLERSFDAGVTWIVCGVGGSGAQAIYTSAGTGSDVSFVASEPENGVNYRLRCTANTSSTINYRMSTTSPAPTAWGIPVG